MGSTITRTLTRDMPNGDRYVAEIELRQNDPRGLSDSFSLTGHVYRARKNTSGATRQRQGRDWDESGSIGEELARIFPQLAPLARLHLSDPNGIPMHAEANGWYWYQGSGRIAEDDLAQYHGGNATIYAHQLADRGLEDSDDGRQAYCYAVTCELLRVAEIPIEIKTHEQFSTFVTAQHERWQAEASNGRALIESLSKANT